MCGWGRKMGHQISLLCAIYGYKTKCSDVIPEMLKKADNFVNNYLPGRVEKGKMTKEVAEAARKNISFTGDMKEAAKDADFVIEAATKFLTLKRRYLLISTNSRPLMPFWRRTAHLS